MRRILSDNAYFGKSDLINNVQLCSEVDNIEQTSAISCSDTTALFTSIYTIQSQYVALFRVVGPLVAHSSQSLRAYPIVQLVPFWPHL